MYAIRSYYEPDDVRPLPGADQLRPLGLDQAHGEIEGASLAQTALHPEAPAHLLGELLGDGQAEPRAAQLSGGRADLA